MKNLGVLYGDEFVKLGLAFPPTRQDVTGLLTLGHIPAEKAQTPGRPRESL